METEELPARYCFQSIMSYVRTIRYVLYDTLTYITLVYITFCQIYYSDYII